MKTNALLAALRETGTTLAVAESITGGRLQAEITSISGISEVFLGGITAYNLEQKVRHLGVARGHAKKVNCVSLRVAAEMAKGACALFDADLAMATTGYAEVSPARGIETPVAYWTIYSREKNIYAYGEIRGQGLSRTAMQRLVAKVAFKELSAFTRGFIRTRREKLPCGHPNAAECLINGECGTCRTAGKLEEIAKSEKGGLARAAATLAKHFRNGDITYHRKGTPLDKTHEMLGS